MDFTSGFINSLVNGGITPKSTSQIVPTSRFKRLASSDDRGVKRSISYKLTVEYDFAYGYAKDHKTGFEVKYSSYSKDQSLTRADLARIKAMMKVKKAQEDAEIAKRHSTIAARAKIKWAAAKSSGTHPYLHRKKVALGSARILGDSLIISIHEPDGELVSWQTINAHGDKRFPFGGKKQGCWHTIGAINPTKPIYVCEGWATGASIAAALDCAVVVAFDAGNLMPVLKGLRKLYSNAPIIVAGDNDASQTGQKAAAACAKAVKNCSFKIPETVNSDFNDLDANGIRSILCPPASSPDGVLQTQDNVQTIGGDWRDLLIRDAKGAMVSSSLKNAVLHIQYHEVMQGVFAYDEFKRDLMMVKCPPWIEEAEFKVGAVTDLIFNQCAAYMEDHGLVMTKDKAAAAIEIAANENKFHSARIYFQDLVWDGKPRLKTMFLDHFGCKSEDAGYLGWVATKWMTAAVKRIMEPGCKFDHVLVLESTIQGVSKSSTLKTLVTFGDDVTETYHTDSVSVNEIGNTYTPLKMQGVMIVELAELKGFSKQDDESIKNWITQTIDEVKLPFDRRTTKYKRQFVFAATTNRHDYLKDPTGNRRYWPITIEKVIDLDVLAAERSQLWAEAVHNYRAGMYIGPTMEENEQADFERQKRLNHDAWTDSVMKIVENMDLSEFKLSHVMDKMDLKLHDKNDRAQNRIKTILQMNGYENRPMWNAKTQKTERMWSLKDAT